MNKLQVTLLIAITALLVFTLYVRRNDWHDQVVRIIHETVNESAIKPNPNSP